MRCAVAILGLLMSTETLSAGSKIYLGSSSKGTQSFANVDHRPWDRLLRTYVDSNGMVDYRNLQASVQDQRALGDYLEQLSKANPSAAASRDDRMAFWINAYNAVTIKGILREYPTSSIRNHTARFIGYNIWKDLMLYVGGQPYSLEAIEHQVLRKMKEPRIHFAIVCASMGCPRLLSEAYVATRIEEQLEHNAIDFFGRSKNFRYDVSKRRFYLSAILHWFESDFGDSQAAQMRRIAPWLPAHAQQAARENQASVEFLDYNWQLNDQSKTTKQ